MMNKRNSRFRPVAQCIPLTLLSMSLAACFTSSSGESPEIQSAFENCNEIQGVFEHARELTNTRLIGDALLKCGRDCTMGVSAADSAFAFRYRSGKLHWSLVHVPSEDVIAKGVSQMQCERGLMSFHGSRQANDLAGKTRYTVYMAVNTKGQLTTFSQSKMAGVFIGAPIPIFISDSNISSPKTLPPAADLQGKIDQLLSKKASTNKFARMQRNNRAVLEAARIKAQKKAAKEAEVHATAKRKWVKKQGRPVQAELVQGEILKLEGIELTLQDASYRHALDGRYSMSKATIIARKDGQSRTLYLSRDHISNDLNYVPIFEKSIALRSSSAYAQPKKVLINLLNNTFSE